MSEGATAVVWLNQDLRLHDNQALYHASLKYDSLIILYILDETIARELGDRQRWWLYYNLKNLNQDLSKKHNANLLFIEGSPEKHFKSITKQHSVDAIYWNKSYMPHDRHYMALFDKLAKTQTIEIQSFNSHLWTNPAVIKNKSGGYYKVYNAFVRFLFVPVNAG